MKTLLFIAILMVSFLVANHKFNKLNHTISTKQATIDTLTIERDSLLVASQTKDATIAVQRKHMAQCSFIARNQVKTVTNGRWIELKHNFDMLIAHQDLSIENLINMSNATN